MKNDIGNDKISSSLPHVKKAFGSLVKIMTGKKDVSVTFDSERRMDLTFNAGIGKTTDDNVKFSRLTEILNKKFGNDERVEIVLDSENGHKDATHLRMVFFKTFIAMEDCKQIAENLDGMKKAEITRNAKAAGVVIFKKVNKRDVMRAKTPGQQRKILHKLGLDT